MATPAPSSPSIEPTEESPPPHVVLTKERILDQVPQAPKKKKRGGRPRLPPEETTPPFLRRDTSSSSDSDDNVNRGSHWDPPSNRSESPLHARILFHAPESPQAGPGGVSPQNSTPESTRRLLQAFTLRDSPSRK